MIESQPKRLLGRIDKIYTGVRKRDGKAWGYLVTEDWKRYRWQEDDREDTAGQLRHGDIVSFVPWHSETVAGQPGEARRLQLVKRETNPEVFGKFARFVREKGEQLA